MFVPLYWLLKVTGLDNGPLLAFCSLASLFNAYTSTRTFSNSTETALTTAALALWPWDSANQLTSLKKSDEVQSPIPASASHFAASLSLAAVATLLRPSNVIIWIVMGASLIIALPTNLERLRAVKTASFVGAAALVFCFAIDSLFYGVPSFTPYTFLVQNVWNSISLFYGANPFHFYLTQALPFTTMTLLPFIINGVYTGSSSPKPRLAAIVAITTIGTYSLLGHKEFRFIYPILPILHCFAAHSLVSLSSSITVLNPPVTSIFTTLSIRPSHAAFVLVSLIPAIYLTSFHYLAQATVMKTLRDIPSSELKSIAFLMPCHSTPWQSHLHRKDLEVEGLGGSGEGGRAWFLTCEPPVLGQNASTYRDQSDYFYEDPIQYLLTRFPPAVDPAFPPSPFTIPSFSDNSMDLGWRHEWPSHVVVFQDLLTSFGGVVAGLLKQRGYVEYKRMWNSHFQDDARRTGDVVVLKWSK
ncbi:GPI mannosyltransferase 3, partial [Phenoliferia sp. Uapishka_3]